MEQLLAYWERTRAGGDREDGREQVAEARELHAQLVIATSRHLRPLADAPRGFTAEDRDFAQELMGWGYGEWRVSERAAHKAEVWELVASDEYSDKDLVRLHSRRRANYEKRLREHVGDLKRARRKPGLGDRLRLARCLWYGRGQFLSQYEAAARGILAALRSCGEFTPVECEAFRYTHTMRRNGGMGIWRLDPFMQEFSLFGLDDSYGCYGLCVCSLLRRSKTWTRDLLCETWKYYLQVAAEYVSQARQAERDHMRQRRARRTETGLERIRGGAEDEQTEDERADGYVSDGAAIRDPTSDEAVERDTLRRLERMAERLPGKKRRRAAESFIKHGDIKRAAEDADCHVSWVYQALKDLRWLMEELSKLE